MWHARSCSPTFSRLTAIHAMLTIGRITSTVARPTTRRKPIRSPRSVTTREADGGVAERAPRARPHDREHEDDEQPEGHAAQPGRRGRELERLLGEERAREPDGHEDDLVARKDDADVDRGGKDARREPRRACPGARAPDQLSCSLGGAPRSSCLACLRRSKRSTILAVSTSSDIPCSRTASVVSATMPDGGLADHADEVDSRDDAFDVEAGDDLVDGNLLDDAHEVDLRDHVLGDPLDQHRHERRRLRLVAFLLAPAAISLNRHSVSSTGRSDQRTMRGRVTTRATPAPRLMTSSTTIAVTRSTVIAIPATAPGSNAGRGCGRVRGARPAGRRSPRARRPAGGSAREPDGPEPHLRATPEHLGRARHGRFDGLGHGLHDGHGPPG